MLEFKIQQHPNLIVAIAAIRLMGVEQLIVHHRRERQIIAAVKDIVHVNKSRSNNQPMFTLWQSKSACRHGVVNIGHVRHVCILARLFVYDL